nr:MAG TPA: hypothetical protein [Caudoviricetes sp.]
MLAFICRCLLCRFFKLRENISPAPLVLVGAKRYNGCNFFNRFFFFNHTEHFVILFCCPLCKPTIFVAKFVDITKIKSVHFKYLLFLLLFFCHDIITSKEVKIMNTELTKDAQKLVALLYKSYLERRKSGMSKTNAKFFELNEIYSLTDDSPEDVDETIREIKSVYPLKEDIIGNITLSDKMISYMENRFKKGLVDILSFLAQFIP